MTMNEKQRLCMGCMNTTAFEGKCPRCGYQNGKPYSCEFLAPKTEVDNRYLVGKLLSHNGEGATYMGYDTEEERKVFIVEYMPRTLASRNESDGSVLPRAGKEAQFKALMYDFIENAQLLQQLGAKSAILPVLDTVGQGGTAYAIYRYIQAETLSDYLKANGGELGWAQAKPMLMPLLQSVLLLHQQGAVHCGVSPETVFVDATGKLWLTGFAVSAARTGMSELDCELFEGYAAPEQYSSKGWQGTWTDVYACAAVAYRMLTGTRPLSADIRIEKDSLYPPNMLNASISASVSDAVDLAMMVQVEKRTQNMEQFMASLLETPDSNTAIFDAQECVKTEKTPVVQGRTRREMPFSLKVMVYTSIVLLAVLAVVYITVIMPMMSPSSSQPSVLEDESSTSQSAAPSSEPSPADVAVPDFAGQFVSKVQESPAYQAKYEFIIREEYNEDDVPQGVIYNQSPDAGTPMLNKGSVILYVSKGSQVTKMPNLVGSTRELAERTLYEMKIMCDIEYLDDDTLKPGLVIKTSVQPGEDITKERDMVILYIKKEAESVVIEP